MNCPECGSLMILRNGQYGPFYGCVRFPSCKGVHGAHRDGRPLGIPADKETRQARVKAHEAFDTLWRNSSRAWMSRSAAYRWMQEAMGLDRSEAHIGRFTKEQCARLCALVEARRKG